MPEPLITLQVAYGRQAEYREHVGVAVSEPASAIVDITKRQKLSTELQVAALMALFKLSACAAPTESSALSTALQSLLQEKGQSRDIALARLAAMTSTALRCSLLIANKRCQGKAVTSPCHVLVYCCLC
jgi:hypothetical protein